MLIAATQQTANPLVTLLPFLLVGVALYFIMIRPQRKRMQAQQDLRKSVEVGDEILTIGGIFGIVRYVDEENDELTIEVSPGTTVRIVSSAIARRVSEDEEEPDDGPWVEEQDDAGSGEEQ